MKQSIYHYMPGALLLFAALLPVALTIIDKAGFYPALDILNTQKEAPSQGQGYTLPSLAGSLTVPGSRLGRRERID